MATVAVTRPAAQRTRRRTFAEDPRAATIGAALTAAADADAACPDGHASGRCGGGESPEACFRCARSLVSWVAVAAVPRHWRVLSAGSARRDGPVVVRVVAVSRSATRTRRVAPVEPRRVSQAALQAPRQVPVAHRQTRPRTAGCLALVVVQAAATEAVLVVLVGSTVAAVAGQLARTVPTLVPAAVAAGDHHHRDVLLVTSHPRSYCPRRCPTNTSTPTSGF